MSPTGGTRRGRGRGGRPARQDDNTEPSPEWLPVQQRRELEASRAARTPSTEESGHSPQPPPVHQRGEGKRKVRRPSRWGQEENLAQTPKGRPQTRSQNFLFRQDILHAGGLEALQQAAHLVDNDEDEAPGLLAQEDEASDEEEDQEEAHLNDAVEAGGADSGDEEVRGQEQAQPIVQNVPPQQPGPVLPSHAGPALPQWPALPDLKTVHSTYIPTHKWPPKAARGELTRELGTLWSKLAAKMDDQELWIMLLIFPRVILPATAPKPHEGQSLAQQVKARLTRWRAGEAARLWQETVEMQAANAKPRRRRKHGQAGGEEMTEEEKRLKKNAQRAAKIAGEGQFTRALQALTSAGMAEQTMDTERKMKGKHPAAQKPVGPLPTTEHAPLSVSSEDVKRAATNFRKGSAPGPSGLRPEHLRAALLSSNSRKDSTLVALTRFVNRMLAGEVPTAVAPYLCGARLHAGNKKDGGIRPIAVGNLVRRLTSKCAAAAVASKAAALLSPLQVGVGVRGGCEAILHAARRVMEEPGDKLLLQADLVNAFNQADRGAALQEVADQFPELLPWVITSYSSPSFLRFGNVDITSSSGFHQGDPLASLLFALVLHPVIISIVMQVPSLALHTWFLDDGTLIGTADELGQVVDVLLQEGPARGLFLSTRNTVDDPTKAKTTVWSRPVDNDDDEPIQRGIPRVREAGITLLGAPIGDQSFVEAFLKKKVEKVAEITGLLPHLQDPHTEFSLLRSCLSLPKLMFTLRTVATTPHHQASLSKFDQLTREALTRILGTPIPDLQWDQAKLPVALGGLGLRGALDHAAAAYSTSFLSSQPLVREMLAAADDEPAATLPLSLLNSLTTSLQKEEIISQEYVSVLTQKQLSAEIDLVNHGRLSIAVEAAGEREVARLKSLGLPHAGAWLNCPPMPALGLHLRGQEFVVAVKCRIGLPIFNSAGKCPACNKDSDMLGDHALVCAFGGERIARHNSLRDALHSTAAEAGLAPMKEGRALLPGTDKRPADIFIPHWAGGLDAALDVTVTHPLQDATRAGAATTAGFALNKAYDRKVAAVGELCQQQGIAFIPIVAESLGGWHPTAVEQFRKLGSALARQTGQEESEAIAHLITRASILLQKGLTSLLINRIPGHPSAVIGGVQ